MIPRAAMIFAAGLGTRMGALTADRPKPLIEVAGRPLIDPALAYAKEAGADPIVVNVHYRADQLRAHLSHEPVRIADETAQLLETGGGLKAALPLLGEGPVWTLNSDAAWSGPNPLAALARAWRPGMEALLLLVPRERALGYAGAGDFDLDATGRLARGTSYVYTGAQILRTEGLAEIPETVFSLNRLWDRAAACGGLFGLVHEGRWCDVGRPENLALAEDLLREEAR
ncbi:nucleotidyltransferase [Rubellimicrobium mesophilum DSM 19309]|uniref:Nucleotidyltransferase n=1 Tax=Rubellimicrobium mesophilum DSM 19309 TaxID=442562 RepID=A0A017HK76_9RHOB|nr:nucleotidyltransferase family protein [Rubellimicrobium mesophilum]EYD74174.1 nucleotidyltransferase [Rubellimicrobium mesophilum DSM 19309]